MILIADCSNNVGLVREQPRRYCARQDEQLAILSDVLGCYFMITWRLVLLGFGKDMYRVAMMETRYDHEPTVFKASH